MDLERPMALLGGLSAVDFMRRHWQRMPRLIRAAVSAPLAGFDRRRLFALAAREDVESRLVVHSGHDWTVRHGPLPRRSLPALTTPRWTLLVQGVDLHDHAAHQLRERFRFVGDARLDDVMLSFATDGGGVGPHLDSYDVFLLQVAGRRRWRVGRSADPAWRRDVPLKMLRGFVASHDWVLEPGDMLYLPPGWGHDGIAVGECLTASIGFRAPVESGLAAELVQRIAEAAVEDGESAAVRHDRRYGDAGEPATDRPARIPERLRRYADTAVERLLADTRRREQALGEVLSEPKPGTWFERSPGASAGVRVGAVALDRATRMLYDDRHVFINGESFRASGLDATLMRRLADRRHLDARSVARASAGARDLLADWLLAGWCSAIEDFEEDPT
ncbi:MAG: cupin domain-containing protein [Caldimonas sp.]